MVQEFQVLKCFSCETFQSHIVKKTNKWECKICGAKQSVKKVYGRGSGKDCRIHTQKLNTLRGLKQETESHVRPIKEISETEPYFQHIPINENLPSSIKDENIVFKRNSKWVEFIDDNNTSTNQNVLNKPDGFISMGTHGSKAKKRKTKDDFDDDHEEGYHSHDFHSVHENDLTLLSTHFSTYKKKTKFNKHNVPKNNSYKINNVDSDSQDICYESPEPINNYTINNVQSGNKSNCGRKLALCPENVDETNLFKITSRNTSNVSQKTLKVSLKWAKYLDGEEESSVGGSSLVKTNLNHDFESEDYTGIKKTKLSEVCPEDRRDSNYSRNKTCVYSRNEGSDNTRDFEVNFPNSEVEPIFPSSLAEKNLDNFVFNSDAEENGELNSNWSSNRDNCSDSAMKIKSCNSNENSLLFESNNVKLGLNSRDKPLKNGHNKYVNSSFITESLQEENLQNPQTNCLPVFEQSGDLSDSDFQLDF